MDRISLLLTFNRLNTRNKFDVFIDTCKDLTGKGKDRNNINSNENSLFKVRREKRIKIK
jgi:hypothetical protein